MVILMGKGLVSSNLGLKLIIVGDSTDTEVERTEATEIADTGLRDIDDGDSINTVSVVAIVFVIVTVMLACTVTPILYWDR